MTDGTEDLISLLHRTRGRRLTGPELTHLHELMASSFGNDYQMWNPLLQSGTDVLNGTE